MKCFTKNLPFISSSSGYIYIYIRFTKSASLSPSSFRNKYISLGIDKYGQQQQQSLPEPTRRGEGGKNLEDSQSSFKGYDDINVDCV